MTNYRIIAQRDPQWSNVPLGNQTSLSIGGWGCLLCCYAMLGNVDPLTMQSALLARNGFAGAMMNTVEIPTITRKASYKGISNWYNDIVDGAALAQLYAWLRIDGNAAVVLVDPTPQMPGLQSGEMHFVLAIGINESGIIIHDPWQGNEMNLCPAYGAVDGAAIYQWRLYSITETIPKV